MRHLTYLLLFLSFQIVNAQSVSFNTESDVVSYMDGKTFYNSNNGLELEYGYISSYNTYGIKVKNMNGIRFYFINVQVSCYGSFADLYGVGVSDGSNFGFRLYNGKLIVGKGESGEQTFYLQ
jgi:hypothetical protein